MYICVCACVCATPLTTWTPVCVSLRVGFNFEHAVLCHFFGTASSIPCT